jgi:excisionase family DNA binding protein
MSELFAGQMRNSLESGQFQGYLQNNFVTSMNHQDRETSPSLQPDLLTVREACSALRISKTMMLRLVSGDVATQPKLRCVRLGRRLLIRRETLERFIRQAEGGQFPA